MVSDFVQNDHSKCHFGRNTGSLMPKGISGCVVFFICVRSLLNLRKSEPVLFRLTYTLERVLRSKNGIGQTLEIAKPPNGESHQPGTAQPASLRGGIVRIEIASPPEIEHQPVRGAGKCIQVSENLLKY